ncbi:glycosyltransferase family 4 protein [Candidatus Wolfebacteria bacterium]|nr:glycosyltransferase family 4 protein [Candidatus Wolfebacteria bacterium]
MKLIYIANIRFPTEKAHGVHIVKMCEALAQNGAEVVLVMPERKNYIKKNIFEYYGVKKIFEIKYLPVIDLVGSGFLGYWISQAYFTIALLRQKFNKSECVILTRDEWSGWILAVKKYRVFYDMHGFPVKWRFLWKRSMKRMSGIICTNEWKMEQCHNVFGISRQRLLLARNGFDPELFSIAVGKNEARRILNLPEDKKIILYSGHLYDWKGVDILAAAAPIRLEDLFVFVGGSSREVEEFVKRIDLCDNILVLGQKRFQDVPIYLRAADVLALPNSCRSSNSRFVNYSMFDTSPIKLFEYMASGRPVVSSDLPSLREVLNKKNAVFAKPDDHESLAKAITSVLTGEKLSAELAEQARQDVQQYTWNNRGKIILDFILRILFEGNNNYGKFK